MNSQFKIRNLLVWTTFLALVLAVGNTAFRGNDFSVTLFCIFVAPWLCSVHLINRLLDATKLPPADHGQIVGESPTSRTAAFQLSPSWQALTTLFLGIYSMAMLMLANVAFHPEWKSKGFHWSYYLLDGWAGATLWPIHLVAVGFFIRNLYSRHAKPFRQLVSAVVLMLISFWHVLACLCFNYVNDHVYGVVLVPLSTGTGYLLYSLNVIRHGNIWEGRFSIREWWIFGSSIFTALVLKIPLAKQLYDSLPDEPPEDCFIVSAAARGTPSWVGSELDLASGKSINDQLRTFRSFEEWLRLRFPRFHRCLRSIYNRVGPWVAAWIRFRWQADLMYSILKPAEWIATWLLRLSR